MSAIVTDQFRILNASNFIDSIDNSSNSYYVFLGLSNPTDPAIGFGRTSVWNSNPPNPVDNIDYSNHYKSTILFGKRITSSNTRRVIRKNNWISGQKYEMYRHDYSSSIGYRSPITDTGRLYDTNYYVLNSDYRVYICIDNGSSGINPTGNASTVEPTFTDLEPSKLSDGYVWKYLYTISPSDIIKFDSTEYITLPNNWSSSTDPQIVAVRENGNSSLNENQIKKVYIKSQGAGYSSGTYDIVGDGTGGEVSITVDANGKIIDATVISGGKNYTFAMVDLGTTSSKTTDFAELIPIIPPAKGHGFDIYKELGADKVLIYARFDDSTKDFPVDTKFAQVGIVKNPTVYDPTGINTSLFYENNFSGLHSLKLYNVQNGVFSVGDKITQTQISNNNEKAIGYVVSYDSETTVLKYYKDRSLYFNQQYGSQLDYAGISTYFTDTGSARDFNNTDSISNGNGVTASIQSGFSGISTTVSNKIIGLGVNFTGGLANPEINSKSGDVIYIDNRLSVSRNSRQKEDIKIILEF